MSLVVVKFFVNPRVQKKTRVPLPGELFVVRRNIFQKFSDIQQILFYKVIVGVLVSYFVHVKETYSVKIVETIPAV